jgi:hypothetical protein
MEQQKYLEANDYRRKKQGLGGVGAVKEGRAGLLPHAWLI